jgi:serine/threonine-protein kinase
VNALDGGSSVGRYRILKFLGAGAMGEVYLAEDPQIDRKLAIKTVRLAGRPQEIEERKKRLLREARAAGRFLHPNVVTLFDAGEAEGLLYLAFEFVEGTDLAARLDSGDRLSLREALRVVRQTAEALDYAHGQGIVHRDIKPSNILLDRAGRVKVADFGIAKMAGQSTELTMAGSVMGSPQYLSPEQIRGEDLDGRSDVFSLGVVFYEILSGKRPFDGDTITTLVYQILHKEPPPVSELRAVPPRLEELLRRMLAKDRDERLATAGEVARELAVLEAELSDETLSAPAGTDGMDATYVLPRRTTGAEAPGAPPPPPPPAGLRSTRGTVPASPPTTPSVPPPPPRMPATPAMPAMPAMSEPAPSVIAASAGAPRRSLIWIPVAAVLLLVAVIAGAWYMLARPRQAQAPSQTARADPGAQTQAPVSNPTAPMAPTAPVAPTAQPAQIGQTQTARTAPPPTVAPVQPETMPSAEPVKPPPVAPERPVPSPPAAQERPRLEPSAPSPVEPEPARPSREPEPEPEPEEPAPSLPQADQTVRTGLTVSFRVMPPDAHVLVDGRVIGQAQDYSGQKGARTFTFPGPGTYLVKIRKPGLKEQRIAVEAGAGGAAAISARLQSMAAEEVEASDLRTVRVREGVSFRVQPPGAAVLVDGQPVGLARRFSGGPLHPREFLRLEPGKHRVSIVSPGYQRQDVQVVVTETAEKDRERIEVVLSPGGEG